MTTAHKPTWIPAMGSNKTGVNMGVPTRTYSSRDLPGHLQLKVRQEGQENQSDLRYKDFKAELLEKEKKYFRSKDEKAGIFKADDEPEIKSIKEPAGPYKKLRTSTEGGVAKKPNLLTQYDDEDDSAEDEKKTLLKNKPIKTLIADDANDKSSSESEKDDNGKGESVNPFPQDADDPDFANTSSESEKPTKNKKAGNSSSESSESDSDEDDDEELLMREYQKIKEQREVEERQKQLLKEEELDKQRQQNLLKHNPLLEQSGQYSLKRKWYEDTVFKNQAKRNKEEKQRFINDNVRSDFHKKFLKKFIYT